MRPPHLATQRTRPDRRKGGGVLCTVQGGNPPPFRVTAARLHGHSRAFPLTVLPRGCMVHVTHAMLHGAWRAAHRPTPRYHRVLARAEADAEETDRKVSELTEQVLRCASQARLPRGPEPARCRAWGAGAVRRVALGRLRARWSAAHARAQARRGNPSAAPRPDRMHRTHAPHGAVAADAA